MFGLTRREQYWKAEQKAAETLVDLIKAVNELSQLRAENARQAERITELEEVKHGLRNALHDYTAPQPPAIDRDAVIEECFNACKNAIMSYTGLVRKEYVIAALKEALATLKT